MTPLDTIYGARSFPTIADSMIKTVINQYDLYGSAGWNINFTVTDSSDTNRSMKKTRLTRTKILDANTNTWSEECYTYDKYGRVTTRRVYIPELAQSKKFQYYYDASGRVLKTMYQDGQSDSFYQWFTYDNLSRLDSVFSSRTNNRSTAVREAVYDYDNNHGGKVLQTRLGNNIQTLDYSYNVRDWLKTLNSSQFTETLKYDDATVNPRYNGNIAQAAWITAGSPGAYNFTYDKANRLTEALSVSPVTFNLQSQTLTGTYTNSTGDSTYLKDITISAGSNVTIQSHNSMRLQAGFTSNGATVSLKPGVITAGSGGGAGDYSEKNISYDANGNIKTLTRGTAAAIVYAYDTQKPNRLNSVSGGLVASYTYDANGNMLRDGKNKFGYDYRNMPIRDTLVNGKIIRFAYDAGGQRIKYLRYATNGTTLLDSSRIFVLSNGKITAEYIYKQSTTSWSVDFYNVYGNDLVAQLDAATNTREFLVKDHLGSTRVLLKDNNTITATYTYYPFGKLAQSTGNAGAIAENFTGHQLDAESSLLYAGARYYNFDIGRWISTDPMNEYASPYVYVGNNPVNLIDPSGMQSEDEKIPEYVHNEEIVITADRPSPLHEGNSGYTINPHEYRYWMEQWSRSADQAMRRAGEAIADATLTVATIAFEPLDWAMMGYDAYQNGLQPYMALAAMTPLTGKLAKLAFKQLNFSSKIEKQLAKRGWTKESVKATTDSPHATSKALNKGTGGEATAYFNKDGSHVVVDNTTGDVIQVTDRNNTTVRHRL